MGEEETRVRCQVFVDLWNIQGGVQEFADHYHFDGRSRKLWLDYRHLSRLLVADRQNEGATVFDAVAPPGVRYPNFRLHRSIEASGLDLVFREGFSTTADHLVVRKEVNIALATQLLRAAYEDEYDVAILVSDDSDFAPCLEQVERLGKQVEVAGFTGQMSSRLCTTRRKIHAIERLPVFTLKYKRPLDPPETQSMEVETSALKRDH